MKNNNLAAKKIISVKRHRFAKFAATRSRGHSSSGPSARLVPCPPRELCIQ